MPTTYLTYSELRAEALGNEVMPVGPGFYSFLTDPTLLTVGPGTRLSPQCRNFGLDYVHQQVRKAGTLPTNRGAAHGPALATGQYGANGPLCRQSGVRADWDTRLLASYLLLPDDIKTAFGRATTYRAVKLT